MIDWLLMRVLEPDLEAQTRLKAIEGYYTVESNESRRLPMEHDLVE
jgi:hypothetical protein